MHSDYNVLGKTNLWVDFYTGFNFSQIGLIISIYEIKFGETPIILFKNIVYKKKIGGSNTETKNSCDATIYHGETKTGGCGPTCTTQLSEWDI